MCFFIRPIFIGRSVLGSSLLEISVLVAPKSSIRRIVARIYPTRSCRVELCTRRVVERGGGEASIDFNQLCCRQSDARETDRSDVEARARARVLQSSRIPSGVPLARYALPLFRYSDIRASWNGKEMGGQGKDMREETKKGPTVVVHRREILHVANNKLIHLGAERRGGPRPEIFRQFDSSRMRPPIEQ